MKINPILFCILSPIVGFLIVLLACLAIKYLMWVVAFICFTFIGAMALSAITKDDN